MTDLPLGATAEPGAAIPVPTLPNLRDLGGWPTDGGGSVRRGMVFRSMALGFLGDGDVPRVEALGLRTVFDLRTAVERSASPDRSLDGVTDIPLDVLADAQDSAAASLPQALGDPDRANRLLSGGRAVELLRDSYRQMVVLPSARDAYGRFLRDLADDARRPALFHCTAGKDRTGWAAVVLLLLLGVSADDARRDYLLTNDQLLPAVGPVLAHAEASGIDPDLLRPVLGVRGDYLDAAFDEVRRAYGSFDGYVRDGLGIGPGVRASLRRALVTD